MGARGAVVTKCLVRDTAGGGGAGGMNGGQLEKMRRRRDFRRTQPQYFMLGLLVPATAAQQESVGGVSKRYDEELRPDLMVDAIKAFQARGTEADVWKLEGLDSADSARMVAEACRAGEGRENVGVVILGRGADSAAVRRWLSNAAAQPAFLGFAVGRTIWWEALQGLLGGKMTRDEAVALVAKIYTDLVNLWTEARANAAK